MPVSSLGLWGRHPHLQPLLLCLQAVQPRPVQSRRKCSSTSFALQTQLFSDLDPSRWSRGAGSSSVSVRTGAKCAHLVTNRLCGGRPVSIWGLGPSSASPSTRFICFSVCSASSWRISCCPVDSSFELVPTLPEMPFPPTEPARGLCPPLPGKLLLSHQGPPTPQIDQEWFTQGVSSPSTAEGATVWWHDMAVSLTSDLLDPPGIFQSEESSSTTVPSTSRTARSASSRPWRAGTPAPWPSA